MKISTTRTYHARAAGRKSLSMPDGVSAFKLYYLDIVGRQDSSRYEWSKSALDKPEFEAGLQASGWEGVGFVTAFPHIAKMFRFAPESETVLHVFAFSPADLASLDLSRGEPWLEFACYAEAAIAADEYHLWAKALTVEEYLRDFSTFADGPIVRHDKLRAWCSAGFAG
jgi:hypothetical protein